MSAPPEAITGTVTAVGNGGGQRQIETAARAVAVHRGQQNLARAAFRAFAGPCDRIASGRIAAAAHEGLPAVADALGVNRQNHGLRAEFRGEFGEQLRAPQRRRIHGELVGAGAENGAAFVHVGDAAAGGERNRQFGGDAANRFEKRGPMVARGGDIQHHQFVGAFAVVARRQRGGIAGIAQIDEVARP